jgi:hypothetical protein
MSHEIHREEGNPDHEMSREEAKKALEGFGDSLQRGKQINNPYLSVNKGFYGASLITRTAGKQPELSNKGEALSIDELKAIATHSQQLNGMITEILEEGPIRTVDKNVLIQRRGELRTILELSAKKIALNIEHEIIQEVINEQQLRSSMTKHVGEIEISKVNELIRESLAGQIGQPKLFKEKGLPRVGADLAEHVLIKNHEKDMHDTAESVDKWLNERGNQ